MLFQVIFDLVVQFRMESCYNSCRQQRRIIMGTFFWDFGDYNDIEREWVMFVVNILAFFFTFYSLVRTAKHHGKVLFELLPLSINTVATLVLLFIKLFEKGYEFQMVGYAIEIFTYFLFCYTFAVMHSKLIAKHRFNLNKLCNFLFFSLAITLIVFIVLIMSSVVAKDCDNDLKEASIAGFATEFLSYLPTLYFGVDIIRSITRKHEEEKAESSKELFLFAPVSDQYIRERKKQIKLVLGAYTLSLCLRAFVLVFNLAADDSMFTCVDCDSVKIITSDFWIGQFVLVIVEVNQLIPHLVIPIALYVIPIKKLRKTSDINLDETLIEFEDEQDDSHSDTAIQRRISNSIMVRSIGSPKKTSQISEDETST